MLTAGMFVCLPFLSKDSLNYLIKIKYIYFYFISYISLYRVNITCYFFVCMQFVYLSHTMSVAFLNTLTAVMHVYLFIYF